MSFRKFHALKNGTFFLVGTLHKLAFGLYTLVSALYILVSTFYILVSALYVLDNAGRHAYPYHHAHKCLIPQNYE